MKEDQMTSETKNTNTDNGFDRKGMEGLLSKKISELIAEGHIDKLEKLLGSCLRVKTSKSRSSIL